MERSVYAEVQRLIEPLYRKLGLVASKAVVQIVKDSLGLQGLQVTGLSDEVFPETTEHMQPGGLTHVPPKGAEGVILTIGGVRDDAVVLCVSARKYRPKSLKPGETALYNAGDKQSTIKLLEDGSVVATSGGSKKSTITMDADGNVTVNSADGGKVTINTVEIDADGNVMIPGDTTGKGEITAMAASPGTAVKVSTHLHPSGVGPTGSPTPGT